MSHIDRMSAYDLLCGIDFDFSADFTCVDALHNLFVTGITADSSSVRNGNAFVCIPGLHINGHDFIPEAISRGASLIILEETRNTGNVPSVKVRDSRAAFAFMCNNFYGKPASSGKIKIIAVTGTNGKTTTTHMLRDVFSAAGYKTGIFGTVTNTLTTPDPDRFYPALADMIDSGVEYVFMEASSHALALRKLAPARFEAGIFMNLTPEHLDFHGTMENYMRAKGLLMRQSKLCLINYDDPCRDFMASESGMTFDGGKNSFDYDKCKYDEKNENCAESGNPDAKKQVKFFSVLSDGADFTAKNAKCLGVNGIRYDFLTLNRLFRVDCPVPGSFTVQNSLAAVSCAYALGIDPRVISDAMRKIKGVPGRLERISLYCKYANCISEDCKSVWCKSKNRNPDKGKQYTTESTEKTETIESIELAKPNKPEKTCAEKYSSSSPNRAITVFIDYAHTPDALEKLLYTVRDFKTPQQRLTLLFGCGGDRDKSKRAVMGAIASRLADFVIITSDNSRTENPDDIIRGILKGIDKELPHIVIPDRREAIRYAVRNAHDNEIILLAGKGHEMYELNARGRFPFDEREIVRTECEAAGIYPCDENAVKSGFAADSDVDTDV